MSLIQLFPLRTGLYDEVLKDADTLTRLDYFLRPLFNQNAEKAYNLNKAFQLQRPVRRRAEADSEEELDFDEEEWIREQERLRKEKLKRYEVSLGRILGYAARTGEISLMEISALTQEKEEERREMIPNVEIFKEIMVELIRNQEIDIAALLRERSEFIQDRPEEFQLNEMLLRLVEEYPMFRHVSKVETYRIEDGSTAVFSGIPDGEGKKREIRCSNVRLRVFREE